MDIIFQLYKRLFVIILGAAILCVIGCIVIVIALLVFGDSDSNPCDCRDDMFSQISVYPDASLVENSENSTTTAGSFVKTTYETTDAFENVVAFFEQQGCITSALSLTDGFECTKGSEHFWYEVEISHETENTSYTITFTWNCGCLD
ncbi:MAG: hypothetical protein K8L91_23500 [Anaerolineae bacterium]|nr:hypothetical protein [Anaerolineae bacterium]